MKLLPLFKQTWLCWIMVSALSNQVEAYECDYEVTASATPQQKVFERSHQESGTAYGFYDDNKDKSVQKVKALLMADCANSAAFKCSSNDVVCQEGYEDSGKEIWVKCFLTGKVPDVYTEARSVKQERCNKLVKCQQNLVNGYLTQGYSPAIYEDQMNVINQLLGIHSCLKQIEEPRGY